MIYDSSNFDATCERFLKNSMSEDHSIAIKTTFSVPGFLTQFATKNKDNGDVKRVINSISVVGAGSRNLSVTASTCVGVFVHVCVFVFPFFMFWASPFRQIGVS